VICPDSVDGWSLFGSARWASPSWRSGRALPLILRGENYLKRAGRWRVTEGRLCRCFGWKIAVLAYCLWEAAEGRPSRSGALLTGALEARPSAARRAVPRPRPSRAPSNRARHVRGAVRRQWRVNWAVGLAHICCKERLAIVVTPADDFSHLGLPSRPIRHRVYSLAGSRQRGDWVGTARET